MIASIARLPVPRPLRRASRRLFLPSSIEESELGSSTLGCRPEGCLPPLPRWRTWFEQRHPKGARQSRRWGWIRSFKHTNRLALGLRHQFLILGQHSVTLATQFAPHGIGGFSDACLLDQF